MQGFHKVFVCVRVRLKLLLVWMWDLTRSSVKCLGYRVFEAKFLVASDEKLDNREQDRVYTSQECENIFNRFSLKSLVVYVSIKLSANFHEPYFFSMSRVYHGWCFGGLVCAK